jgi:translation initiation factor IF-3
LERIAVDLEDVGRVEQQPSLEGRTMLMILSPSSK